MKDSVFHKFCGKENFCFYTKYNKSCNDISSLMAKNVQKVCFFKREILYQTKHKLTTKRAFLSKESIVYHWEHKKRFNVKWRWIAPDNTIYWTLWLHFIVQSLININTKTICHWAILHYRQLLCSVILY